MEFIDVIKNRYSCHDFSDKQVEPELLEKIVNAGGIAPVGMGSYENFYMVAIAKSETVERIRQAIIDNEGDDRTYGAQAYVLVYSDAINDNPHYKTSLQTVGCLMDHMSLAATELGVDSLYLHGCFNRLAESNSTNLDFLDVPENFQVVCALGIGYAKEAHESLGDVKSKIEYKII